MESGGSCDCSRNRGRFLCTSLAGAACRAVATRSARAVEAIRLDGRPPSVNRFIGLSWLAARLYPEESGINLHEEMKMYYRLFYHYELDDVECAALLAGDRVLP